MARITQKMASARRLLEMPARVHLDETLWNLAAMLARAAYDAKAETVPHYVEAAQRLYDHADDDLQQEPGWRAENDRLALRFLYSLLLASQGE
jgi:hypothetical protein